MGAGPAQPLGNAGITNEQRLGRRRYRGLAARRYAFFGVAGILLCLAVVVDITTGPAALPLEAVLRTLLAPRSAPAASRAIVWLLRVPTALMAVAIGASLGVAGAEMQTILNNPLASPYTLGIASAAGFGAALGLVAGAGAWACLTALLVPAGAFIMALLCSFTAYEIAKRRRASTETIVLAGIAMHSLFSALLALVEYLATQEQLHAIIFWLFGDLSKATWPHLAIVAAVLLVALPVLARDAWRLTALRLGDGKAENLGVDVKRLRRRVILIVSALAAAATCFVGTIGFVGLVGPHIARMLVGEDQRFFMPFSGLCGALLLSAASVVSKNVVVGVAFPVGIITSLVGIPFFLALLLARGRRPV